ncbi:N-acetyltransferase 9 [Galdieria sulphuraria]|nr:N-acetyltransferase 9 [Galdieria sulphuraria]
MASPFSTSFFSLTEGGDMLEADTLESERPYSSRLEQSGSYLLPSLDDGDALGFRCFSRKLYEEHLPASLNHFHSDDSYGITFEQLQGGTLGHQWSNSSLSSQLTSESCFSLQRSTSLPTNTVRNSQVYGLTDHHHESDEKDSDVIGKLVTRRSCPPGRIAQVNGSSFQVLSPVSNRDSSYSTVDADESDSGSFDGTQFAKTRRSRARLNHNLEKLRELLPSSECSRRESKSNLIKRACKYIAFLQKETGKRHVIIKQ